MGGVSSSVCACTSPCTFSHICSQYIDIHTHLSEANAHGAAALSNNATLTGIASVEVLRRDFRSCPGTLSIRRAGNWLVRCLGGVGYGGVYKRSQLLP